MLGDLLSSRLIQTGLALFVVCVGGSLLYSWHVRRTTDAELAQHERFLREREQQKVARAAEAIQVPTEPAPADFVDTPGQNTDTPISDETDVSPRDATSEGAALAETFGPGDVVSDEETTEDGPVSPQGFGPYPEIPADYPEHLMPFWVRNPNFDGVSEHAAGPFELMDRVLIKLWKQGHTTLTGASLSNATGKIYPHYANTAYVRYKEFTTPDGVVHRQVSKIRGGPDIAPFLGQIGRGNTPAHIQLLDYDSEGIDPHTFLREEN